MKFSLLNFILLLCKKGDISILKCYSGYKSLKASLNGSNPG